ncbi:MAG: aminotransferase class V-fold PLP-dependent enzyme [Chlamydiia bacterium]
MDRETIRDQFPQLQTDMGEGRLVYLDTAATSLKPRRVIDRMTHILSKEYSTANRGLYPLVQSTTAKVYEVRRSLAAFLGAEEPECVIFCRGATDALNMVALGLMHRLQPGDEILVTAQEHHSNLVPWQLLAQRTGAHLRILPLLADGRWDLQQLPSVMGPRTKIVACSLVSNVLGCRNPVEELVQAARVHGSLVVCDAAQAVGHMDVHLGELGCDFLACSAHKIYGPTGIGALVGRREALEQLMPVQGGGDMIQEVWLDHSTWAELPYRMEAGTPSIVEILAWGTAIEWLREVTYGSDRRGPSAIGQACRQLLVPLMEDLRDRGFQLFPSCVEAHTLVTMTHPEWHPADLATMLGLKGIAVRSGHMCAQPLLRHFGVEHALRISLGAYSTAMDMEALGEALDALDLRRKCRYRIKGTSPAASHVPR